MDATLKRRMWKIAIGHFALSFVVFFAPLALAFNSKTGGFFGFMMEYGDKVCLLMQPHLFFFIMGDFNTSPWVFWSFVALTPLWSLCFGWLIAQLLPGLAHMGQWLAQRNPFPGWLGKIFAEDAARKARIRKVAIIHFLLSWVVIGMIGKLAAIPPGASRIVAAWVSVESSLVWWMFSSLILGCIQPQIFLVGQFWPDLRHYDELVSPLCFLSIPLWSICFGWIFIRTKDWLNHFPALGRKAF